MPKSPGDSDDEYRAWVQRLRDQSRRDAESLVPRPDYPVYGLAAPTLTPAVLLHQSTNGFPVLVALRYGSWETATGPHVTVTSAAPNSERRAASTIPGVPPSFTYGLPVRDPESDLLREIAEARLREAAIDETLRRALLADTVASEPAQRAWDRYWSEHLTWLRVDPQAAERLAQARARETLAEDWLRAWADWAATA